LNYEQIKSNLVVYLLRVRCKQCFKSLSKDSFWQFSDDADQFSFSSKKFFNINKRPDSNPLKSNVKLFFDRYYNNIWNPIVRETNSLTKQISRNKHKTIIVTLFCSSCSEVINLEYILDR